MAEWAAWYSGDTRQLSSIYGAGAKSSTGQSLARGGKEGYTPLIERMRFWGRRGSNTPASRQQLHVPAASDIASTSADLLFGEDPTVVIREAHEKTAESDAKAAEDRLQEIVEHIGLTNTLLEGAEICAGIGGVFLRPGWDLENSPEYPTLDIIHGDAAVPEWRGKLLVAVTFWKVLHRENNTVFRLLERHERGVILNGLYVGDSQHLGQQVPLTRHPESADLTEEVVLPAVLNQRLLVRYVPNVLPNRMHRHLPQGRADFAGSEALMDSLDEAYTSWMRDIRLGQARIVVSEDALTKRSRGEGATFDADQEIFTKLNLDPTQKGDPITPVQFAIRTQEHMVAVTHLFEKIVTGAGYSPQTFGLHIEGAAESGTALRVREGKSLKTRGRKARYFEPALQETLEILLAIDREILNRRDHGVYRPSVDVADVIVNNPIEVAQSLSLFRTAQAMSIETAVRLAQPDLDEAGVQAETQRIKDETAVVADPTGGFV